VRAAEVPVDSVVTVLPDTDVAHAADSQAVLLHLPPGAIVPRSGRESWSPEGFVAYSRLCTHAGCPVGLFNADDLTLLCPCHQSTFDAAQHGQPTFGPAARPLPQLPLAIDADGFLVATGDFSEPVGPAWWSR
jgi:ubiquinol-cytochrome c reductase iron-sulfur subunit